MNTKEEKHEIWAEQIRQRIQAIMQNVHHDQHNYTCEIEHIERVKPYGPHLDHLVVDLLLTRTS